ncbi:MAG: hypothetical protein DSZ04_02980 [Sulfurimonas sp.]|nr:MAG: hypothetical protein DSZ04_02980 [Sulfurimonas sp.]
MEELERDRVLRRCDDYDSDKYNVVYKDGTEESIRLNVCGYDPFGPPLVLDLLDDLDLKLVDYVHVI